VFALALSCLVMGGLKLKIKQSPINKTEDELKFVFQKIEEMIYTLPLFTELGADLLPLLPYVRQFRQFQNVIVLGTGGSSLSGQLFSKFKALSGPNIHFFDNIDPYEWSKAFSTIDLGSTGVISISKSGNTTETLCQTLTAIKMWQGLPIPDHFLFVSDPRESALKKIAEYYGIPCLDHPVGIGGRFSGFSVVGYLPALIGGIDAKSITLGAQAVVRNFLEVGPTNENITLQSAFLTDDLFTKDISMSVLFCYAKRLLPFAFWYRQLWAESLGKKKLDENKSSYIRYGLTPVISAGTVDQHSQLQLYIDGPRDKFFTLLTVGDHPQTCTIDGSNFADPMLQALDKHTMAELIRVHQQIIIKTFEDENIPLRSIHIPKLDEENIGQLMMTSILETLALSCIWDIDPFNQPGVNAGKDKIIEMIKNPML
jgi:glucose-6-phosphate isomerase